MGPHKQVNCDYPDQTFLILTFSYFQETAEVA